jgi:hypothetical protein
VKGRQDSAVASEDNTNEESKEALGKKGAKRKRNIGQATRQSPRIKPHGKEVEKEVDQEQSEEAVDKLPKKPRKQPKQKAVSNQVHHLAHCLLFLFWYDACVQKKGNQGRRYPAKATTVVPPFQPSLFICRFSGVHSVEQRDGGLNTSTSQQHARRWEARPGNEAT